MIKIQMGACTLVLEKHDWKAYDAQGQRWPEGERYARDMLRNEIFFSQEPDIELGMAKHFIQKSGGRIVEHIPVVYELAPDKMY